LIKISFITVNPAKVDKLRQWMKEASSRKKEVLETLKAEGIKHEIVYLLERSVPPILIYATESEDHEKARAAFKESKFPIDEQHKGVMREITLDFLTPEKLLDALTCFPS